MILSGASAYMIAFVVERLLSLILMKFLIQDISPEIFGVWMQVISVSSLVNLILMLRLDNALISVLAGEDKNKRKGYFILAIIAILPTSLIAILGFYIFDAKLSILIFGTETLRYLLFPLLLFSIVEAIGYVAYAYLRVMQFQRLLSLYYFVRFGGRSVLLIWLLGPMGLSVLESLYWLSAFGVILAVLCFMPGANYYPRRSDIFDIFKRAGREGIAQMFVAIIYWCIGNIDRYVIIYFNGLEQMTRYAFLIGISVPISLLPSILQQALLPALSKASFKNDAYFKQLSFDLFKVNAFIGIAAIAGLVAVSPLLTNLIGTPEFALDKLTFLLVGVVMLAMSFEQIFSGMFAARRQSSIHLRISFAMLFLYVVLLFWATPLYGLVGVLAARLTSLLVGMILMCIRLHFLPLDSRFSYALVRWLITALLMFVLLSHLAELDIFSNGWVTLTLLIIIGIFIHFALNLSYVRHELRVMFFRNYEA